jgi:hypothetical protein
MWLKIGYKAGSGEDGNESSGFIKTWNLLSSCATHSFSRKTVPQN